MTHTQQITHNTLFKTTSISSDRHTWNLSRCINSHSYLYLHLLYLPRYLCSVSSCFYLLFLINAIPCQVKQVVITRTGHSGEGPSIPGIHVNQPPAPLRKLSRSVFFSWDHRSHMCRKVICSVVFRLFCCYKQWKVFVHTVSLMSLIIFAVLCAIIWLSLCVVLSVGCMSFF